jgi:hypothetical protein
MVIPLAFVSVLLLAAVLVFGALAFDFGLPGMGGDDEDFAAPGEVLESSGFIMRDQQIDGAVTTADVEVSIFNTSDQPVESFEVVVQCDDGGYISAISEVSGMDPGENRTVAMKLSGHGEPGCHEPIVEFSESRSGN